MPRQFVRNDEIVLNISFEATSQLQMGNEWIEFSARFSGKSHKIEVQVANVLAIYARENGQGMAFPVEQTHSGARNWRVLPSGRDRLSVRRGRSRSPLRERAESAPKDEPQAATDDDDASKSPARSHLKVVK